MYVDFNILNQLGSPAINSNTLANRPAAGYRGRLFVSIDTFALYRDNGTGWDLIGGPGTGTVTGSGVATRVAFWDGTSSISSNSNLYWDNTNARLGIGTTTPGTKLDIHGTGTIAQFNGTGTSNSIIAWQQAGVSQYTSGYNYNGGTRQHWQLFDSVGAKNVLGVLQSSRFVGVNYQFTGVNDVPRYTFDVFGNVGGTGTFDFGGDTITRFISTGNRIYTKYLTTDLGFDLDYSTSNLWFGNSVDGYGLKLDYQNGVFKLGDFNNIFSGTNPQIVFELGSDVIRTDFFNSPVGLKIFNNSGNIDTYLGDFDSNFSGVSFLIENSSQSISSRYYGNEVGIKLDFINNNYYFGIPQGNSDGYGLLVTGSYNGIVNLGDYDAHANGTSITLDCLNDRLFFNTGTGKYNFSSVLNFLNNAAALAGGLTAGQIYRQTGTDFLCIVH